MIAGRRIVLIIVAVLASSMLVACGGDDTQPATDTPMPEIDLDVDSTVSEDQRGSTYFEIIGETYTYSDTDPETTILVDGQFITITLGSLTETPLGIGPMPRDIEPGTYDIEPFGLVPGERDLSGQFNEIEAEMVFVSTSGTLTIDTVGDTISGSFEFGAIQRPRDDSEPQTAVIRGAFADVEMPDAPAGLETPDDE